MTPKPKAKIIHLTENHVVAEPLPPSPSFKARFTVGLLKFLFAAALIIAGSLYIAHGVEDGKKILSNTIATARAELLEKLTVTKVVREYVEPTKDSLDAIIQRTATEYHFDPIILQVVAEKESNFGQALYRFEPDLFLRLRQMKAYSRYSEDELRMLASSHGPFHVLGATAGRECNLAWHRLYDLPTSARCAGSIIARLQNEAKGVKDPSQRLWTVFKGFNGSGPKAEAYADRALRRVGEILYARMVKD